MLPDRVSNPELMPGTSVYMYLVTLKRYSPCILLISLFAKKTPELAFPVFIEVEQCRNKSDSAIFYKYLYNKKGKISAHLVAM